MILPAKHLKPDRSLLGIGSEILTELEDEQTVSELWERLQAARATQSKSISFDWFVVALSFLYAIGTIDYSDGIVSARSPS